MERLRKKMNSNQENSRFIFPINSKYSISNRFNYAQNYSITDDCINIFKYNFQQLDKLEEERERIEKYKISKLSSKNKRIVVFSSCTNSYDEVRCPLYLDSNFDYVLYTDSLEYDYGVWDIRRVPYYIEDPTRISRYVKTHPHYLLSDYDVAIWIDTNVCISGDFSDEIKHFLDSGCPIAAFYHPLRKNVYEEAQKCINLNKDDPKEIDLQIKRYKNQGYNNNDLIESNFMMFNLKHEKLTDILNLWWAEIDNFSRRDQLSLNYSIDKNNEKWYPISGINKCARNHEKLVYFPHKTYEDISKEINRSLFYKKAYPRENKSFIKYKNEVINKYINFKVDIIVPIHNALDDLKKCINSLAKYRKNCMYNCILVDDASDEYTEKYINGLNEKYDWIKNVRNSNPVGYGRAVNIGIKHSSADFLIFLNSDTIVTDSWVEKMVDAVYSTVGAGIVGPISNAASYQSIPNTKFGQNNQTAINLLPKGLSIDEINSYLESWAEFGCYPTVPLVHGFCFGVKREVLTKIGGFDEINFPKGYGEENDFCFRASDNGFRIVIAINTYIFHAKSKSYTDDIRVPLMKEGNATLHCLYGKNRIKRAIGSLSKNPILLSVQTKAKMIYSYVHNQMKKIFILSDNNINDLDAFEWWIRITPWLSEGFVNRANVVVCKPNSLPSLSDVGICLIQNNYTISSEIEFKEWIKNWKQKGGIIICDVTKSSFLGNDINCNSNILDEQFAVISKQNLRNIIYADCVTCPTENLVNILSKLNNNVKLVPYSLDNQLWHLGKIEMNNICYNLYHDEVIIGIIDMFQNSIDYSALSTVETLMKDSYKNDISFVSITDKQNSIIGIKNNLPNSRHYTIFVEWLFKIIDWNMLIIPRMKDLELRDLLIRISFALGICVVIENDERLPCFLEKGTNCILVEPNNINSYVNELNKLINNKQIMHEIALNAKHFSLQFDCELQVNILEELIATF